MIADPAEKVHLFLANKIVPFIALQDIDARAEQLGNEILSPAMAVHYETLLYAFVQ